MRFAFVFGFVLLPPLSDEFCPAGIDVGLLWMGFSTGVDAVLLSGGFSHGCIAHSCVVDFGSL